MEEFLIVFQSCNYMRKTNVTKKKTYLIPKDQAEEKKERGRQLEGNAQKCAQQVWCENFKFYFYQYET